jgi:NADPH:quinone reductase-like Zn-dependent oxidoreductase
VKAALLPAYGPPEVLVIGEAERPQPGPRDILVRVLASSVNPVDTKLRSGLQRLIARYRLPWILGLDVSGVVEEVGGEVTRFRVGDEIFASPRHSRPGCYAEYVAIDEAEAARKPDNLTHVEAASIPLAGLTAWDCLVRIARVQRGDKVLIHAGAGGVGTLAIQLAKHLGAIVATTCSAKNADFVRELGADIVVDYRRERFEEVLVAQDMVLESLGSDSINRSLPVVRRGGTLVSIQPGLPQRAARYGRLVGTAVTGLALAWLPVRGWLRYGVRARSLLVREPSGAHLGELAALLSAKTIRPVIDRVLPLDEIVEAHRHVETGHARGKVVIRIGEGAG